jgi:GDP-L-fucose synthase
MPESCLLSGPLEPTNKWYAVAKINSIKMGQAYRLQHGMDIISVMPTNLYGPRDNFDTVSSHVLPALIRKMHDAKVAGAPTVGLWGTGSPRRELLYVEDLVDALVFLMNNYSEHEIINVGTGKDLSIKELAQMVARTVGYEGELVFDSSKPDGTQLKLCDSRRLFALGWRPKVELQEGIQKTYEWFLANFVGANQEQEPGQAFRVRA